MLVVFGLADVKFMLHSLLVSGCSRLVPRFFVFYKDMVRIWRTLEKKKAMMHQVTKILLLVFIN
jgi:hypothetical protein